MLVRVAEGREAEKDSDDERRLTLIDTEAVAVGVGRLTLPRDGDGESDAEPVPREIVSDVEPRDDVKPMDGLSEAASEAERLFGAHFN